MLNSALRIAGIQSRTIHPASAGSVKYSTSSTNDGLLQQLPHGACRATGGAQRCRRRSCGGFLSSRNSGTA